MLRALGNGDAIQGVVKISLGVALLFAAASMVVKALLDLRKARQRGASRRPARRRDRRSSRSCVRPVPTLLVGIVGGLVVGMTSVGSGSLIIVALLLLYPSSGPASWSAPTWCRPSRWSRRRRSAHLLFGDFQLDLTASLLIGALPGVYVGAQLSSSAPPAASSAGPSSSCCSPRA